MSNLTNFKVPRWKDLPDIPLYLDQILILLDEWYGEYLTVGGKKIMTKTMVNNYVKLKFIPAPVNKKYNKISVASIFIIAILKTVFTIDEVSKLINLALNFVDDTAEAYDMFCNLIEEAVDCAFSDVLMEKPFCENDPRHICWNACNALHASFM
jgi:hypothetical protein